MFSSMNFDVFWRIQAGWAKAGQWPCLGRIFGSKLWIEPFFGKTPIFSALGLFDPVSSSVDERA